MAAVIVDNFAEGLLERLESPEIIMGSIWETKLKNEVEDVRSIVRAVRGKLPAAEKLQTSSLTVRDSLEKLADELLEADDLLDHIRYSKDANPSDLLQITNNLNDSKEIIFKDGFIKEKNVVNQPSFGNPDNLYGRDDELKRIVKLLRESSSMSSLATKLRACVSTLLSFKGTLIRILEPTIVGTSSTKPSSNNPATHTPNVLVVAVVGLLGSGKTTLVNAVPHDVDIKRHFRLTLQASVSNLLGFEEILTRILFPNALERDNPMLSLHEKRDELSKNIRGKRYLLVLDDLSTIDIHVWNTLRALLETGAPGSKILITTRYKNIAKTVASSDKYLFTLGALSDEGAWLLFKSISPAKTDEHKQIGENIVRRCENSPLVITLAADIVAHETNWQQFGDNNLDIMAMFIQHKNRHLLNEIRPNSYNQLSPHLKHCVAYCSLFPRDYEFRKQTLIQLWMAQGFLKLQDSSSSSLENAGEKQFKTLLEMSFFEPVKLDVLGNIITCRMRGMFHYLALNVAGTRCITASGNTKFDSRTLHVSAKFNGSFPNQLMTARKLRTLVYHKESDSETKLSRSICQMIIEKLTLLRTLNLSDCGIDVLPDDVGNLIHLRYLDLSKNYLLVTIPESVTKLSNLQSMNLNLCQQLKCLPSSMERLTMLRCLEIDECDSLTFMPLGLEKLASLQSLNRFVVSVPSGVKEGSGGIGVLKDLKSLTGRLKIELSGQWEEQVHCAKSANLKEKKYLTDLKIEWRVEASDYTKNFHNYEAFLEALHPPSSLKVLCIEGYQGRDFPSWAKMGTLTHFLPHLVSVDVEGCKECKHIPLFGDLKNLKYLTLRNMEAVKYMVGVVYNPEETPPQFESLTELTLHSFYSLEGWWKETTVTAKYGWPSFPKLEKLKIWNCPKLTSMPLFNNVEEVDFQDVSQKLLVTNIETSVKTSSKASQIFETLKSFFFEKSTRDVSHPLLQNLTKLKTLRIKSCPQMNSFPKVWDEAIQCLVIKKCDALETVANGLQRLKSLKTLEISHCEKLWDNIKSFPWGSLTKLEHFTIRGFSQMKVFPEDSEMINALQTVKFLHIASCSHLTDLPGWIEEMWSLKHLRLEACPNLTKLPESSNCLQGLDKLEIMECPQLMERCREGGEDRYKIRRDAKVLLHKSWRFGLGNNV